MSPADLYIQLAVSTLPPYWQAEWQVIYGLGNEKIGNVAKPNHLHVIRKSGYFPSRKRNAEQTQYSFSVLPWLILLTISYIDCINEEGRFRGRISKFQVALQTVWPPNSTCLIPNTFYRFGTISKQSNFFGLCGNFPFIFRLEISTRN